MNDKANRLLQLSHGAGWAVLGVITAAYFLYLAWTGLESRMDVLPLFLIAMAFYLKFRDSSLKRTR